MRVSAYFDDPDYINLDAAARVFVDGIDVTHKCYAADEEKGIAYCYALDDAGNPKIMNNDVVRVEMRGVVKITVGNQQP